MTDVVLAFENSDAAFAHTVRRFLLAKGINVWSEQEADPGSSLVETAASSVVDAKAVIVLWSEQSVRSPSVTGTALMANARRKHIALSIGKEQILPHFFKGKEQLVWTLQNWPEVEERLLAILTARGVEIGSRIESDFGTKEAVSVNRGFAFFSHVEEDILIVTKISAFLKTRGYANWTYHESDRDYQKPTMLEIEERMNDCALVLTVISSDWKRSEWTQRELAFAREIRKPMFHLRFRNPGPMLAIAGDTYFDFERGEEDAFRKLGIELDKNGL